MKEALRIAEGLTSVICVTVLSVVIVIFGYRLKLKVKGLEGRYMLTIWMGSYISNCKFGYQGKDKYHGNGMVGCVRDGKGFRRATAKRRKKRVK